MKLIILYILSTFVVGVAFANDNTVAADTSQTTGRQQQQQQQQSTNTASTSQSSNAGNSQSVNFMSPESSTTTINGTQSVRNVPGIAAPNLTSSNDTCMGSTSVGTTMMGFGISFGTTWTDKNCVMLKNGRELWNMGMRHAGLARLCMDSLNRRALEQTGFACPESKSEDVAKQ